MYFESRLLVFQTFGNNYICIYDKNGPPELSKYWAEALWVLYAPRECDGGGMGSL